jgi:hypothetical protein
MSNFNEGMPCRVTADLARHEAEQREAAMEAPEFDEYDETHIQQILGNDRLAKPIQNLLLTLRDMQAISRSFGDSSIDRERMYSVLVPRLQALQEACVDAWKDL